MSANSVWFFGLSRNDILIYYTNYVHYGVACKLWFWRVGGQHDYICKQERTTFYMLAECKFEKPLTKGEFQ